MILLRVWLVLLAVLLCAYAKPDVELRKAQPEKIMTALLNRERKDTFIFTPQLSNNVKARANKYAVLQQIRFNLGLARSLKLQRPPLVFVRTSVS